MFDSLLLIWASVFCDMQGSRLAVLMSVVVIFLSSSRQFLNNDWTALFWSAFRRPFVDFRGSAKTNVYILALDIDIFAYMHIERVKQ